MYNERSRKRNGIFPNVVNNKEIKIYDMISEYSIRSLSNQSDRLNGFMGILGVFETSPHRLQNFWGTPIVPNSRMFLDLATRSRQTTRERQSVVGFVDGICWSIKEFQPSTSRLPSFPSWSWAGWTRGVDYWSTITSTPGVEKTFEIVVRVELCGM
jgi:hypothetical protein